MRPPLLPQSDLPPLVPKEKPNRHGSRQNSLVLSIGTDLENGDLEAPGGLRRQTAILDKSTIQAIAANVMRKMETMAMGTGPSLASTFDKRNSITSRNERQNSMITRNTEMPERQPENDKKSDRFRKWCVVGWASAYVVLVGILAICFYLVSYGSYTLSISKIPPKYKIIIDAGSTKTRLNVMAYQETTDLIPLKDYSYTTKIKPGISDFIVNEAGDMVLRTDPHQTLKDYMTILLEDAKLHVPLGKATQIDVCMYATYGMRKLQAKNHSLATNIMKGVNNLLDASPFNNMGARIISSRDEAIGAWVDGNLQFLTNPDEPRGILEMGGGSLQMIADPNNYRTIEGFGIDEAYRQFKEVIKGRKDDPSKMKGWEKGGVVGSANWEECIKIVKKIISERKELQDLKDTHFPERRGYKLVGNFGFIRSFLGIKHCPYGVEVSECGKRLCNIHWDDRHLLKGTKTDYEDGIFSAAYHHELLEQLRDFIIKGESDCADIHWSRGLIALNTVFPKKIPSFTNPLRLADNEFRFLLKRIHKELKPALGK